MTFSLTLRPRRLAKLLACLAGAGILAHSGSAAALGLVEAYQAALKNDPVYRAAFHASEGGKENRILGRSNLLPSLSASYSGSKNRSDISSGARVIHPEYNSKSATLQLRQPLFNLDSLARYKQGVAQSEYSAAQFASQSQEVVLRVVGAYVELLFKREQLDLALAERDMYLEQKKSNERMYEKGEGTKTDVLEVLSRLDLAEAQVLEAIDNETVARDTLAGIIGGEVGALDPLSPNFKVRTGEIFSYEAWKAIAMERNPDVKTQMYAIEIARQEVNKARAGHAPKLDFVASYSKNTSESINTINQDSTVRSIGVQLSIPLYAGGAVNASTRQAVAGQEKAKADLQAQIDKTMLELRKDYTQLISSVSRIAALDKAVESGELLITATEKSIQGGIRVNLDLLNAQRQLSASKRDRAQARYGYLLAMLRLRGAAGTLSSDDVGDLALYFR